MKPIGKQVPLPQTTSTVEVMSTTMQNMRPLDQEEDNMLRCYGNQLNMLVLVILDHMLLLDIVLMLQLNH
jgi:hypothetical protein